MVCKAIQGVDGVGLRKTAQKELSDGNEPLYVFAAKAVDST